MHHKSGKNSLSVILLFSVLLFSACGPREGKKPAPTGFADDNFIDKLQTILKPIDTSNKKNIRSISEYVRYTYQLDEYQPVWVKENYRPIAAAGKFITELEDVKWDGFDPERYELSKLKLLKQKLDTSKTNSVADAIIFDTTLTHSYIAATRDLLLGTINPKRVDSLWFHVNDSTWNTPQLLVNSKGNYPSLEDFRSQVPTYKLLRDEYKLYYTLAADSSFLYALDKVQHFRKYDSGAMDNLNMVIHSEIPWLETTVNDTMSEQVQLISTYQRYKGLQMTGKLDSNTLAHIATSPDTMLKKISANMERVRWMQQKFGDLYLVVDIPLMELFLRKDGVNLMHMRVVVGKPERQTPSLYANMSNIVVNPPWGVPPTILKNDVVPGFQKSGKSYLAKKGLQAYDREGKLVKASTLTNKNFKRYTYKQAPGDDNSLGYVKFNLPNPWDIYLHDTPHREDFGKRFRALSSGCIRVQRPQEMAIFILSELEKRYYTQGKLDTLIKTHKTRWEVLKNKIPVHITYLTAFEDTTGQHLLFTRDVYHRDDKLIATLNGN